MTLQHFSDTLNDTLISVGGMPNNVYGPYLFIHRVMLVLGMLVWIPVFIVMMI
jgi:hypothetical protein